MADAARIELDGQTYQLRPWADKDAKSWTRPLASLFFHPTQTIWPLGTVGHAVANLDGPTWDALSTLVEKYTDVVSVDDKGEKVVPLANVAAVHMQGRLPTLIGLVSAHMEREFGPFFEELMRVLGARRAESPASK
jgi:hypothetical protein